MLEPELLTLPEMRILRSAPYESPALVFGREKQFARRLIARGLLELNPSTPRNAMQVRCTDHGTKVAKPISIAMMRRWIKFVQRVGLKDREAALSFRNKIVVRVLLDVALHTDPEDPTPVRLVEMILLSHIW